MPNIGPAPARCSISASARPPVIVPDGRFGKVRLIRGSPALLSNLHGHTGEGRNPLIGGSCAWTMDTGLRRYDEDSDSLRTGNFLQLNREIGLAKSAASLP